MVLDKLVLDKIVYQSLSFLNPFARETNFVALPPVTPGSSGLAIILL